MLDFEGVFGPTSSLGGTAFGVDTPFKFSAEFDSTADLDATPGMSLFETTIAFEIDGLGTFNSDAASGINVGLIVDSGIFIVGLVDTALATGFFAGFDTSSTVFDADSPSPTVFSDFLAIVPQLPFTVSLAGGAGDLVINDFADADATARINGNLPEPASILVWGLLGIAGGIKLHRRKKVT